MTAGWTAGGVRARALLQRRLGAQGARQVAGCSSLAEALRLLTNSPYRRDVRAGQTLAEAERALGATLLWHLRVLAGWQPRRGAEVVRVLAGGFEVANAVELARAVAGLPAGEFYQLASLATAWRTVAAARLPEQLRAALAASPWGEPGATSPAGIAVAMQLSWAFRVFVRVPEAADWAAGAAALVVARERFAVDRPLPDPVVRHAAALLGPSALDAASLPGLACAVRTSARWTLAGIDDPDELWRAEPRWWRRVRDDGVALLRHPRFGSAALVGCVAVLAADAWRVRAGLELAARSGRPMEAFDALA